MSEDVEGVAAGTVDALRATTGVAGLDDVLNGGLPRHRLYLIEGDPGSGKTTLALQFLLEGARRGEPGIYVSLSETKEELMAVASSHGWSLDRLTLCELGAPEDHLRPDTQYTLFHPSEVEFVETTNAVLGQFERVQPARAVFDSLAEMRLLARDPLRFRRQILALKRFFIGRRCTVLLLDDRSAEAGDARLHSIVSGVLQVEQLTPTYGAERRRLSVVKLRAVSYRGGYHDFVITMGGLVVYPRLRTAGRREPRSPSLVSSGVPEMDALLGGGLHTGTSLLIMGPAGAGKSTLAVRYALAAVERGERAAMYVFDERIGTLFTRSAGLGMDLRGHAAAGRLRLQQIDHAELSPGQFVHSVSASVSHDDAKVVVIDSLNGYLHAMPQERFLTVQLQELLTELGQRGVVTILVSAQNGLVGSLENLDVIYLADTVLLLRHFEADGEVRQAVSVMKKRAGRHERTIRELQFGPDGIRVGEPLRHFAGLLTGVPISTSSTRPLLERPAP